MRDRRVPKKGEIGEGWRNCAECGNPCSAYSKRCGSCGLLGPICVQCLGRNHTFCR